jgi:hypothetical protein
MEHDRDTIGSEDPKQLARFKLVVESDAGPLMLSPTGQFIAPSSCPAFLLLDFVSENLAEAETLLNIYEGTKNKEVLFINRSLVELGLESITKEDNVTPDRMIRCIERLLAHKQLLVPSLRGSRLKVSTFYSVQQDGEVVIPWNWTL